MNTWGLIMSNQQTFHLGYVMVEVSNLNRSVEFFKRVGLVAEFIDAGTGYASFETSGAHLGLIESKDLTAGKATGVGFMVEDLDAAYADLSGIGLRFEQVPTKQDWGGYTAIFSDPDGNTYYLDQMNPPTAEHELTVDENDEVRIGLDINLTAGTLKK